MGVEKSSNASHQGPSPKDPWALTRLATSLDSCKPRSETSNKISTGDTRELVYLFNKYVIICQVMNHPQILGKNIDVGIQILRSL